ncbi:MAG: VanZ family protein [Flavobacteriaceae bacterium]|nr:VanZ family protein [Flavobacteriaceae bacterium]
MPKRILLILAVCYTLFIAIFSLIPIAPLPELGSNFDDKIFHILAYGFLFILWYFTLHSLKVAKPIFYAILFSIIYGIILEVLQGQLTTIRNLDVLDILANCIGVTISSLFIIIKNRTIVKNL